MYACKQNVINLKMYPSLETNLKFICQQAHWLTNCGLYYARQKFFETGELPKKFEVVKALKESEHYKLLHSQAAQQTLMSVEEAFKSFKELDKKFNLGQLHFKPSLPKYRQKNFEDRGYAVVAYPKQALQLHQLNSSTPGNPEFVIRLPLGKLVKERFRVARILIPMPANLKFESIKEVRIVPRNGCFWAEYVYEKQPPAPVDPRNCANVLGIDPGVNNWLSCVSNVGTSFIVDGLKVKSLNQWYNKQISTLKQGQPQGFWSQRLAQITDKRNTQMRDALNKAARMVLNHCLQHDIGAVVFGWNEGQRQEVKLGKTTQTFVQIPTAKLKERIKQLCEAHGIQFVETEESYTSKTSFLDRDVLPVFGGEKPANWQPSGKRINRGMYRTANGQLINADLNGAANILRKVEAQLGFGLAKVSRRSLTVAPRLFVWNTKKAKGSGLSPSCSNASESPRL